MKKSDLKLVIKECVREVLFEEGVLSDVIAEVAFGITKAQNLLTEEVEINEVAQNVQKLEKQRVAAEASRSQRLLETKKKMLNAIGGRDSDKAMQNVFEGTRPLENSDAPGRSPLAGRSPDDEGVDISGLFGALGNKWQHLK